MRSLVTGLVLAIIAGAIGLIILRAVGVLRLPSTNPTPSASPVTPNFDLLPSSSPFGSFAPTPMPSTNPTPTTKGGLVEGTNTYTPRPSTTPKKTTTSTTSTTTRITYINVFESKSCPVEGWSEIRDITSPLDLKYELKAETSATVEIWKVNGESLKGKTLVSGSGTLMTLPSGDGVKIEVKSNKCHSTSDNWLKIFATR